MKDDSGLRRLACWILTGTCLLLPLLPDRGGVLSFPDFQWIICGFVLLVILSIRWLPTLFSWEIRVVYFPFLSLVAVFIGYTLVRAAVSPAFPFSLAELLVGGAVIGYFFVALDCIDHRKQAEKLVNAILLGISLRIIIRLVLKIFGGPALYSPLPGTAGLLLLPASLIKWPGFSFPLALEVVLSGRWPIALISGVLGWLTRRRRLQETSPRGVLPRRRTLWRTASLVLVLVGATAVVGQLGGESTRRNVVPGKGVQLPIHLYRGIVRSVVSSAPWIGMGQGTLETVIPLHKANYLSRPRLEGWKKALLPSLHDLPWILTFVAEQGLLGLAVVILLTGAFFQTAWRQYRYTYDPIYRNIQLCCLSGVLAGCILTAVTGDHLLIPGFIILLVLSAVDLSISKIDLFAVGKVVFTFQRPFRGLKLAGTLIVSILIIVWLTVMLTRYTTASRDVAIGNDHLVSGRVQESMTVLEKAYQTFPYIRALPRLLGKAYLRNGSFKAAHDHLTRALTVTPDYETYLAAAESALKINNPGQARIYIEAAGFHGADEERLRPLQETLQVLEQSSSSKD